MRSSPPRPLITSDPARLTITSFRRVPFSSTDLSGSRLVPTIVALLPKQVGAAPAGSAGTTTPATRATTTMVSGLRNIRFLLLGDAVGGIAYTSHLIEVVNSEAV